MVVKSRNIITESERSRILSLYDVSTFDNYGVIEWLSPDEKYAIFLDELYDIENKTKIGNIFENFDNFKFFLKHSFEVSKDVPQDIREEVLSSINELVLTENNQNFNGLKPYVKQLINEDFLDWGKKQIKGAVQGVKDFTSTAWSGLKKTYNYIADGEWKKAFSLIQKGALYVARKIRQALYTPVGLIFDAILIATGIGKSAQFAIWGVVVALDIYELVSGNYEYPDQSMIVRLLFFGIDLIGLVAAGAAAKAAKSVISAEIKTFGQSTEGIAKAVQQKPLFKSIIKKMYNATTSAGSVMNKASSYLQKNAPMIYKFISGVIGKLSTFIQKLVNIIGSVLKGGFKAVSTPGRAVKSALGGGRLGKGAQAGMNTTAVVYGAEKLMGHEWGSRRRNKGDSDEKINLGNAEYDFSQSL